SGRSHSGESFAAEGFPHAQAWRACSVGVVMTASKELSAMSQFKAIQTQLGDKASYFLEHQSRTVSKEKLHLPGPDFVSREFGGSDRNVQTLRSLQSLFSHGLLAGTG